MRSKDLSFVHAKQGQSCLWSLGESTMPLAATLLTRGKSVQSLSPVQAYPSGVELFQQGEPVQKVYLIHRGLVKLVRREENGQEMIVDLRREGWFLGAPAVILGG